MKKLLPAVVYAIVLVTVGVLVVQVVQLRRELRRLHASIPADYGAELEELRTQIEQLEERVQNAVSAADEAQSSAESAEMAVDELRDDVIAIGIARLR